MGLVSELRENPAGNDLLQSCVAGQSTHLSVSILRQDSHLGREGSSWAPEGTMGKLQRVSLCLWVLVHSSVICFHQGLSTATKDTYDALHMQTLPPR